jgi:hypothetical protein
MKCKESERELLWLVYGGISANASEPELSHENQNLQICNLPNTKQQYSVRGLH